MYVLIPQSHIMLNKKQELFSRLKSLERFCFANDMKYTYDNSWTIVRDVPITFKWEKRFHLYYFWIPLFKFLSSSGLKECQWKLLGYVLKNYRFLLYKCSSSTGVSIYAKTIQKYFNIIRDRILAKKATNT